MPILGQGCWTSCSSLTTCLWVAHQRLWLWITQNTSGPWSSDTETSPDTTNSQGIWSSCPREKLTQLHPGIAAHIPEDHFGWQNGERVVYDKFRRGVPQVENSSQWSKTESHVWVPIPLAAINISLSQYFILIYFQNTKKNKTHTQYFNPICQYTEQSATDFTWLWVWDNVLKTQQILKIYPRGNFFAAATSNIRH